MPMLTHNQIWTAIDRLAARAKLTPSGLAKKAGLDPTTFNKSKRVTPEGRPRWPSTESVAKALQATNTKFDIFVTLITDGGKPAMHNVPLIGFAQAGTGGVFDDDFLDSYIELKMQEIIRFEHTPHPVEYEMYYSA